jgi:hypothetical protein
VLYRNRRDGTFEDVSEQVGIAYTLCNGLGVTIGHFNQDGRPNFYVANDGNPNRLWLQDASGRFEDRAMLAGCAVDRMAAAKAGMGDALGARVRTETDRGTQWRSVQRAYSFLSSHEPQVHFGLNREPQVNRVTVCWVGGESESFGPFHAGQTYELRQGQSHARGP